MKLTMARANSARPVLLLTGIVSAIILSSCVPVYPQSDVVSGLSLSPTPSSTPALAIATIQPGRASATPTTESPAVPTTAAASSNPALPDAPMVLPWVPAPLRTSLQAGAPLDLDKIFPPGDAHDLTIQKCTSVCHRVGIIVRGQRTGARWDAIEWSHRGKTGLGSDAELETIFQYLKSNFNPDHPEPELPPWFLLEEDSPEW